jgi:glycosyltransferase involved in cell wall biosynthesis
MDSKHVVFIADYPFPKGMAITQRERLISKGLVENGVKTTILCLKALEQRPLQNIEHKGYYQGVYFEYTPGTTIRPGSFIKRRWLELKGIIVAILKLVSLKANGETFCIYLSTAMVMNLSLTGIIFRTLAKLLNVPLVVEIVERPWSLKDKPSYLECKISPIIGATGVIVISDYLYNWVQVESNRISKRYSTLYIPTMVDIQEQSNGSCSVLMDEPKLLFAGSPLYKETIRFLFNSMEYVLKQYPRCKLILTGWEKTDPHGFWIESEEIEQSVKDNIIFEGYLPRNDLLELFKECNALLIPLFDDIRSKARFPIKIGEYLLSGRPVITNNVGDIPKYLKNNLSAFICNPGDPKAFAELIIEALSDPAQANVIGQNGKDIALQCFDYSIWVKNLSVFIRALF